MNYTPIPQCVLIGDSLTQYGDNRNGFVQLLRERFQGRLQFVNLGISGLNSAQILEFAQSAEFAAALPKNVNFCVICAGANDAATGGIQALPLAQFLRNCQEIADIMSKICTDITFVAPPPVEGREGRDAARTASYALASRQLTGVKWVDLRENWTENAMLADGIHLNDCGNALMARVLSSVIGEVEFWRRHWSEWE
ncbi:Isoamyl acetate-hydrolyzing esterase 1 protein [Spironucleus salmonicida]|uniref:Isoamyl acetate-hydrolyzing esterase 1 protein n=1 Tax=Spironucleus salmonicida TaxID=348837 RepID=V6LYI5_9EUKA|nr:Isoamyl acetate-hydrolyzing esterase 1 protein [Spironucleus salmonicida]|eukprot:EST45879.1 Isoamyl acetate-hydrolyzing esterase 1 protein [Spironucleus salmonicida]